MGAVEHQNNTTTIGEVIAWSDPNLNDLAKFMIQ